MARTKEGGYSFFSGVLGPVSVAGFSGVISGMSVMGSGGGVVAMVYPIHASIAKRTRTATKAVTSKTISGQ